MNYTIKQFNLDYPDDDACLQAMFDKQYGDLKICPKCGVKDTKFYKLKNRKVYSCMHCRYQIHPLAGTIFHKSATPLKLWFYAIYLFSTSRNGVSAKELERHLGVTYKTAWRIAFQIRRLMSDDEKLDGIVEIDETWIGGSRKGSRGRKLNTKQQIVMGMVERDGKARAKILEGRNTPHMTPFIREHVSEGTHVMTDEYFAYAALKHIGYIHKTVKHKERFAMGDIHTQTIEGFWSQLKRSINGTYHVVSPKHLQSYVDEFAFRHSLRKTSVYPVLMAKAAKRV